MVDHLRFLEAAAQTIVERSEFVTKQVRGAYIAAVGRPDLRFGFSIAPKIVNANKNVALRLNRRIREKKQKKKRVLRLVKLDEKTITFAVFSDATLGSNVHLTSHVGHVVALTEKYGNANLLHFFRANKKNDRICTCS